MLFKIANALKHEGKPTVNCYIGQVNFNALKKCGLYVRELN